MIPKASAGGLPYLVDTQTTRPPIPPRISQAGQQSNFGQTVLFVLVSLALSCIVIEACFIYRLYQSEAVSIICKETFLTLMFVFFLTHLCLINFLLEELIHLDSHF